MAKGEEREERMGYKKDNEKEESEKSTRLGYILTKSAKKGSTERYFFIFICIHYFYIQL